MSPESRILNLYVTPSGEVWGAAGRDIPTQLHSSEREVVDVISQQPDMHVRLLGMSQNAALIVQLADLVEQRGDGRLEVASPLLCDTQQERQNPEIAVGRMRQCRVAASLGGWHVVTEDDRTIYEMVAASKQRDTSPRGTRLVDLFSKHPLSRYLAFVETLDEVCAAKLVAEIIDPRWYVDRANPSRVSRLQSYLGLTPKNFEKLAVRKIKPNTPALRRAELAYAAWADAPQLNAQNTSNFVLERYTLAGGGHIGALRATQVFICYLARTWQHVIVNAGPVPQDMFLPAELLHGEHLKAYRAYEAATLAD